MTLEQTTGNCPLCKEPRNRHLIVGKLVDVEIWHNVFTGSIMMPSIADTPLIGVDTAKDLGPLIKRPVIGEMLEGTEAPRMRPRRR